MFLTMHYRPAFYSKFDPSLLKNSLSVFLRCLELSLLGYDKEKVFFLNLSQNAEKSEIQP